MTVALVLGTTMLSESRREEVGRRTEIVGVVSSAFDAAEAFDERR